MRADQLAAQRVQRVEPGGINYEPAENRLVIWGIHGAGDYVTALRIGGALVERLPPDPLTGAPREEVDALRVRAMRSLPPDALRDSKGSAVGYFLYAGLPADHCAAAAAREGPL
jgi:hypothetical protein